MGRRPKLTLLSPEKTEMAKRHIKRCSTLLIIREMQVKTAMRYHLTQDEIAIIKKSANNKYWKRCGEKGIFLQCWWECKYYSHYGELYEVFLTT